MEFDEAFERLLGHEGQLSLDEKDPGNFTGGKVGAGELRGTKYGISAAQYPNADIASLTLADAKALYRADYWDRDKLDQLPDLLRFDVFDGLVNSGTVAIKWLQRALRVNDDGYVGAMTVAAARAQSPYLTLARYNGERLMFMSDCKIWPSQGRGWAKRIARNLMGV